MIKLVLKGEKGTLTETAVTSKPIIIGRGESSTLLINDSSISLNHARVTMRKGKVYIKDMDSTNGVLVNGKRISTAKAQNITPGDEIKIGLHVLHLEEGPGDAESERTKIIKGAGTGPKLKLVLKGEKETSVETSVTSKPIVIGRGEGSTLLLKDSSVSLNHARVTMRKGKVYIRDLDSTNGIFINGKKVSAAKAKNIVPGDEIKIGLNMFSLEEYSQEGSEKTVITKPKSSLTGEDIKPPVDRDKPDIRKERKADTIDKPVHINGSSTLNMDKDTGMLQRPKLVIMNGEDAGKEFYIEGKLLIGRSKDNDIVLKDPLVSRGHHAKVVRHKDDWITITDLNSVNGVLIGKTKIREAILKKGMEIQIGDTVLRFIDRGEVVSLKAEEHEKHVLPEFIRTVPRPILISLSFFVIAVALLLLMSGDKKGPEPEQPAVVNAQKTINENSINSYLSNSLHFMDMESWDEALAELSKILSDDPDNFEAGVLKHKTEAEQGYQDIMKKAADDASENKIQEAIMALEKIPSTSVYYTRAGEEILKYRELVNNLNQD